jgi:hypothetical protein
MKESTISTRKEYADNEVIFGLFLVSVLFLIRRYYIIVPNFKVVEKSSSIVPHSALSLSSLSLETSFISKLYHSRGLL